MKDIIQNIKDEPVKWAVGSIVIIAVVYGIAYNMIVFGYHPNMAI